MDKFSPTVEVKYVRTYIRLCNREKKLLNNFMVYDQFLEISLSVFTTSTSTAEHFFR